MRKQAGEDDEVEQTGWVVALCYTGRRIMPVLAARTAADTTRDARGRRWKRQRHPGISDGGPAPIVGDTAQHVLEAWNTPGISPSFGFNSIPVGVRASSTASNRAATPQPRHVHRHRIVHHHTPRGRSPRHIITLHSPALSVALALVSFCASLLLSASALPPCPEDVSARGPQRVQARVA